MAQSLSSTRIVRLNRLLAALRDNEYISVDDIISQIKYPSKKAFARDLKFLRRAFNVKVTYSRHFHAYHLKDSGDFLLIVSPERAK